MKISVKQACEIDGKTFGPNIHKKPGTFIVPGSFVFIPFFVALVKDEKIKILEVSEQDMKEMEEKGKELKNFEPDPIIISILDSLGVLEQTKEEGDEESDDSDDDSSDDESSEGSKAGNGEADSSQEVVQSGSPSSEDVGEVKKDEAEELMKAEYAELHEKAKRLNKNEKKRYDELKKVLKIEE